MNYKPGICTFCGTGCGHLLRVKDGKIGGVFPSQKHPVSKGRLCVRGWNIHEVLNSSERIETPLIKRNGSLEKATYDEAVSFMVENLSRYKKESSNEIGFLASPRSSNEENFLLMKLARAVFSTNNISLDSEPGHRNSLDVLYKGTGMAGMLGSLEEISKAKFILVIGIDITKQNPIIGSEIHFAANSGAKVVTIDSRTTQMAKLSDRFLQIRPGSNKIIIASMAKTLIEENLLDSNFINKYTEGFEGFANSLGSLNDNGILSKTGIEIDTIKEIAREFAQSESAMVFFSSGISGLDKDTISYIYNLFLMAGKIGKEGCGVNPIAGINNLQGSYDMGIAPDLLTGFQPLNDESVVNKFNDEWGVKLNTQIGKSIYDLLEIGKPRLKALVVIDHDEGIIRNSEEIGKLDFVVYIGAFENKFTEFADVVLPVSTYVEVDGTFTNTERRVQLSRKKINPSDEILSGWKLYSMIAEKAGVKWDYGSPSEVMDEIARLTPAYSGISYEKLQGSFGLQWPCDKDNPNGTSRLRLDDVGEKMRFVTFVGTFDVPSSSDEFPFLLMIGESQHYWHQNNLMRKTFIPLREYNATLLLYPEGYVELSTEDAKELKVRDRWPVRIVSPFGSMDVMVMVSDNVKPSTAYVAYFVEDMVTKFFLEHREIFKRGEDATIPVRIEKV